MEVILLEDVKGTGKKGELVKVKKGYGENYLIKNGLAEPATDGNKKNLKNMKQAKKREEQEEYEEALRVKKVLEADGAKVVIREKAAEDGRLFGSVTNKQIGEEIEKQLGEKVDRRKIETKIQMRAVGSQTAKIKLHPDVEAEVLVVVEASNA